MSEFNIDPVFSVYGLMSRVQNDTTVLNHRRAMSIISYEIENATLVDGANTVIFSSFQRMSKFIPQMNRYATLAKKAKKVYVFGEMDVLPPVIDNVTYVPLARTDQLAKEWFLVSYGVDYFSALATEELSDFESPDHERIFKGIWSFDLRVVSILHEWLSGVVGLRTGERSNDEHDFRNQLRLMRNTLQRMQRRMVAPHPHKQINTELQTMLNTGLVPAIHHMQQTYGDGTYTAKAGTASS